MCGIVGIFETRQEKRELRERAIRWPGACAIAGPDWSGVCSERRAVLAHERLSIVDVEHGAQPLLSADGDAGAGGQRRDLQPPRAARPLRRLSVPDRLRLRGHPRALPRTTGAGLPRSAQRHLRVRPLGQPRNDYLIARDPIGVIPLYFGRDEQGSLYVASELKALDRRLHTIEDFPPGRYLDQRGGRARRYYQPAWRDYERWHGTRRSPASARRSRPPCTAS